MKYYKNKNVSLLSDPTPIKPLSKGTKVLRSLISPSTKEVDCSDAWKFVALHYENGSSHIKGTYFYQYYSPVAHTDSFRINISITAMHRLAATILYVSNAFHNKNVPNNEIFFVSPPPYYIYWFKISYANVPLN